MTKVKRGPSGHRVGEGHHRARLADWQIDLIRWLHIPGITGYETLAEQFECSPSTIRDIVNYRTRYA